MHDLPATRGEAKRIGSIFYFTGRLCRNGHLDKRHTNTGLCYRCKSIKLLGKGILSAENAIRSETSSDGIRNRVVYIFNCRTCNSEIRVRKNNLKYSIGLCRKCAGARPNVRVQLRPFEWCYRGLVRSVDKRGFNKRGIGVALSYEDFLEYTNIKECHYCGVTIEWRPISNKQKKHNTGFNLDRKDSSLGYSQGNVVVCCKVCNRIKGDYLTYTEMLTISPQLTMFRMNRERLDGAGVEIIRSGVQDGEFAAG